MFLQMCSGAIRLARLIMPGFERFVEQTSELLVLDSWSQQHDHKVSSRSFVGLLQFPLGARPMPAEYIAM